jgi:hypothetical protein
MYHDEFQPGSVFRCPICAHVVSLEPLAEEEPKPAPQPEPESIPCCQTCWEIFPGGWICWPWVG